MASIGPEMGGQRPLVVPFPEFGTTGLEATTPAGEAAVVVVRPAASRFLVLEPAVRRGDPAAVHDMRVAARRIRTALRLFRPVVPDQSEALRSELRWSARLLGTVRDVDVQRGWLAASSESVDPEDRAILHLLDDEFEERRGRLHSTLVEGLDSARFEALRNGLSMFARGPGLTSEEASLPVSTVAPMLVEKRYRAMRRAARSLGPDSPSAELHALRIRCKRARYAIESVAPIYGKPADSLAGKLAKLQDLLGDMRDAELASLRLRELADAPHLLPSNAAFVLGAISERSARRARKLRRRYSDAFARTRGRRWKDLRHAMAELSG
jgi:CHAD domain-containing protein